MGDSPGDSIRFLRCDDWLEWLKPEHETDARKQLPRVPPQKPYPEGAKTIALTPPEKVAVSDLSLKDILLRRHSHREYGAKPLSIDQLSFLLWACQGVHRIEPDPVGSGSVTYRTAPSANALHPFETYIAVLRVEGLNPGLYRYLAIEHALLPLRESADVWDEVMAANLGGDFARNGAAYLVWTAIPARTTYVYSIVSGKIIALDAGHMCENLYLAAEVVNAGVCAMGAFYQDKMDAALGVSGDEEFAVYAATVGTMIAN